MKILFIFLLSVFTTNSLIGQFTKLYELNDNSAIKDGELPSFYSEPVIHNGVIYGTNEYGGQNGKMDGGTIFKINVDGSNYTKLHDFSESIGNKPMCRLFLHEGYLYGTTNRGGTYDEGTVFKIKTDGTGYTVLHNFENEGRAQGNSIIHNDVLYGVARSKTSPFGSKIFKINTDGTGYDIVLELVDGFSYQIYGITLLDNSIYFGASSPSDIDYIAKVDLDGANFTKIYEFVEKVRINEFIILDDLTIYGTTNNGGDNGRGIIYKLNSDGTGFETLYSFSDEAGTYNHTRLTLYNSDLYDMTEGGGDNNQGVIFKYNINTNTYTKLLDFDYYNTAGYPVNSFAVYEDMLYGFSYDGGTYEDGVIFSYDPNAPAELIVTKNYLDNTTGSLDWAISQAVTLANSGQDVDILFAVDGAGGAQLVNITTDIPKIVHTTGTITFKPATGYSGQGVKEGLHENFNAGFFLQTNGDVTFENLIFKDYQRKSAIEHDIVNSLTISGCSFIDNKYSYDDVMSNFSFLGELNILNNTLTNQSGSSVFFISNSFNDNCVINIEGNNFQNINWGLDNYSTSKNVTINNNIFKGSYFCLGSPNNWTITNNYFSLENIYIFPLNIAWPVNQVFNKEQNNTWICSEYNEKYPFIDFSTTLNIKQKVVFEGIDIQNGNLRIRGAGAGTIVRKCKISGGAQDKPIYLDDMPSNPQYGMANNGIPSPTINNASFSSNILQIDYTLGDYSSFEKSIVVDFYQSNDNGDFVEYLGSSIEFDDVTNIVTGQHQTTIDLSTLNLTTPLDGGSRIAATVTSLGDDVNWGQGTSEAVYATLSAIIIPSNHFCSIGGSSVTVEATPAGGSLEIINLSNSQSTTQTNPFTFDPTTYTAGQYEIKYSYDTYTISETITVTTPQLFDITPASGTALAGDAIGLSGTEPNASYQLYLDGTAVGTPIAGMADGSAISFGVQTTTGTYTIKSELNACNVDMTGQVEMSLPKVELVVTKNTLDGTIGSLNWAINQANTLAIVGDYGQEVTISFEVLGTNDGQLVQISKTLPALNHTKGSVVFAAGRGFDNQGVRDVISGANIGMFIQSEATVVFDGLTFKNFTNTQDYPLIVQSGQEVTFRNNNFINNYIGFIESEPNSVSILNVINNNYENSRLGFSSKLTDNTKIVNIEKNTFNDCGLAVLNINSCLCENVTINNNTFNCNSINYSGSNHINIWDPVNWSISNNRFNDKSSIITWTTYSSSELRLDQNSNNFWGNEAWFAFVDFSNSGNKCVIENQDIPGAVTVSSSTGVVIRKCKIKKTRENKPIELQNEANNSITMPAIDNVALTGNNLTIDYTLTDYSTYQPNLIVDFYLSNNNGDLLDYMGSSQEFTDGSAIAGTHQQTIDLSALTLSVPVKEGSKIAATITSLGDDVNFGDGTSEVSYGTVPGCSVNLPATTLCGVSDAPITIEGQPSGSTLELIDLSNSQTTTQNNPFSFDPTAYSAGQYEIRYTYNACTSSEIITVTVPQKFSVTPSGVANAGDVVGLTGSENGATYQLYRDGTAVGSPVAGMADGSAINFGTQSTAGLYTVKAQLNSCEADMPGQVGLNEANCLTSSNVSISNQDIIINSDFTVPVNVDEAGGVCYMVACQFNVTYDANIMTYNGYSQAGTLSEGFMIEVNSGTPGLLRIVMASATPAPAVGGSLIDLSFTATNFGSSTLEMSDFYFNVESNTNLTGGTIAIHDYGNVNNDDEVNSFDAGLLNAYIKGQDTSPWGISLPWEEWRITISDVDGVPGLSEGDVQKILDFSNGQITQLPDI